MENLGLMDSFWKNKRVLITGHTGFKGTWLTFWLHKLGAIMTGYALDPPAQPSMFTVTGAGSLIDSIIADIRDLDNLQNIFKRFMPEIVFHLAAQPLVRDSYRLPVDTYAVNVMGTVNILEAIRFCPSVRSVIIVTTDKCYMNREWSWGYRENDRLWGYDPYSSSKACSELVTAAYRDSFFNSLDHEKHGVAVASARSGNVIGGGDWGYDRLVPDCVRAFLAHEIIHIRNPESIRPWQHVLNTLSGYLVLAEQLFYFGKEYADAWNFGPSDDSARSVEWIVRRMCELWSEEVEYRCDKGPHPHETNILKLDSSLARQRLHWKPAMDIDKALNSIIDWTLAYKRKENMADVCFRQISEYEALQERECFD